MQPHDVFSETVEHSTERDEQMSLDAGMVAHINKPYSLQRLKRLITTIES